MRDGTFIRRKQARFLVVVTALAMISACSPWLTRPCLKGEQRTTWLRNRWHEATDPSSPWKTRICATEDAITWYSGDDAIAWQAPACTEELLHRLETDLLRHSPIPYNRLQLARLVGIANALQTRDHMPAKTDALLRVAAIGDNELTEYQLTPGETEPPLPKKIFREIALQALANVHLAMNEPRVLQAVLALRRKATDVVERRLLEDATAEHFENALWGHPKQAVDNGSFALLDQILAETRAALERPYDEIEHGLLLDHLTLMALYAKRFGRETAAVSLARSILERDARVPSVRGRPAARRDLYVAAALAETESQLVQEHVNSPFERFYEEPPRPLSELIFDPALYDRGFECRGMSVSPEEPALLDVVGSRELSEKEKQRVLVMLVERPREVTLRPALRAFALGEASTLERLMPQRSSGRRDPLVLLELAITAADSPDASGQLFLRHIIEAAAKRREAWGLSREVLLAARHARAFGLEQEVQTLADALANQVVDRKRPSFATLASAGLKASLRAARFDPW